MNLMLSLILMSILVAVIFGLIFQMSAKDYQLVMDGSVEKTLGNVSLKGEIIAEALRNIRKSELKTRFINAESRGEHHLYSYLLKEELTKVSSRYLNADFVLSVALPDPESSVINPYGTMFKKDFSKEFFGEEQVLTEKMKELTAQGAGADFSFQSKDELHYMRYEKEADKDYFIFLSLPAGELTGFPSKVNWGMADANGIFAKSGDIPAQQFEQFLNQPDRVFEQKNYRAFTYYIKELNWNLVAVYEKQKLNIGILWLYFLLPFISLSLLIVVISYWITRSLYRPIRELVLETKSLLPDENEEDEFRVLKKGAAQAYKLSQDLQETRSEKEMLLRNKQIRDLLFGILPGETSEFKADCLYSVTVFSLHNIVSEEKRYLLKQYLQEKLENYNQAQYVNTEDISCTMILETESLDHTKRFINEILEDSPIDEVQMAVSDPVFGPEAIKTAYLQCSLILEYKYLYRQQRFLTADLIKVKADENYSYPLSSENNLIQMVLTGQMECLKIYDQIITQNEKAVGAAPQVRHRFVLMLLGTIHRVLREFHMEIPMSYALNDLEENWQDEQIFTKLRQDLTDILTFVASKEQTEDDNLARVMLEYIEKHYHEDIMLVDLAEEINASEKYCSTLFKQAVGENFKTYLNALRIDKAKEIFHRNPQAKIGEVAEQVGFNSANTFIRVFSKQMGLTPKAYVEAYCKAGTQEEHML